ncbi:MAG: alpha/beta fold hydrolase [Myxacorys californica WJT36-NPBG1]|jgi:pimeloyl-ACP methyl ester carboxylesterase|nr:alpha/beta fold hydrolase [Myxacorys californica WJT36-NPBG1]
MLTSSISVRSDYSTWMWKGFQVAYQAEGTAGPAVVLVHGFGASFYHWRKNLPELAKTCRVYAIDLIGFGKSSKPIPDKQMEYTFETWGAQLADFCREVIGEPAFLVGNSIGSIAIMQAAVDAPDWVRGVALVGCSLRLLHERHQATQPWFKRVGAPILQKVLKKKWFGQLFFKQLATPKTVRKVLLKAYGRSDAVTDELVDLLLGAAKDEGAMGVFIAFTNYSQGPLPEDLLPELSCPAIVLWGEADPWEPIALGRAFAEYPRVESFIPLAGVGHCPQDEAPEVVNPILRDWILEKAHTGSNTI